MVHTATLLWLVVNIPTLLGYRQCHCYQRKTEVVQEVKPEHLLSAYNIQVILSGNNSWCSGRLGSFNYIAYSSFLSSHVRNQLPLFMHKSCLLLQVQRTNIHCFHIRFSGSESCSWVFLTDIRTYMDKISLTLVIVGYSFCLVHVMLIPCRSYEKVFRGMFLVLLPPSGTQIKATYAVLSVCFMLARIQAIIGNRLAGEWE